MISIAAALRFGPLVIAGLAVGWALWERSDYFECVAERAEDHRKAHEAKAEALADAQRRSDAIITEQAQALAVTANKAGSYVERIIHVPVSTSCRNSQPVRIGLDGVRDILGSGGGEAATGGGASPAVQRPAGNGSRN